MNISSKKETYLFILIIFISLNSVFSQENIYRPNDLDSLFYYFDKTTDQQIKKLDKNNFSKKKKIYKKRIDVIKDQILDSSYVFVPEITFNLNRVLKNIYNANPELKQYNFYFLISKSIFPNAKAFGDGTFVVNLGLFDFLDSDDELAFVISHEIAHFLSDDVNSQIKRYINLIYSNDTKSKIKKIKRKKYGQTTAGIQLIKELSFDMFDYTREKEIGADLLGYKLFNKTDYNSNAGITALKKLGKLEELVFKDSINLNTFFGYKEYPFKNHWIEKEQSLFGLSEEIDDYEFNKDSLRTHPHTENRISELLINNSIDTTSVSRKTEVLQSLRNLSNHTLIESLFDDKKYDLLLYLSLKNIQNVSSNINNYDNVALILKLIHQSKKEHTLGKNVPQTSPFSEEIYLNQVRLFIHKTELRDLQKIGQLFCFYNKDKITVETYNEIYKYFKL